jgi:hypothetical protein
MNRLEDLFGTPPDPERTDDYFEIETHYDLFAVSGETAQEVERRLDACPTPRWIAFTDLAGRRHRIVAAHLYRISECTAQQRQAAREFYRARRAEDKADKRPWEED